MICFVLLPFSLGSDFLVDATRMDPHMNDWTIAPWTATAGVLVKAMKILLPNFAATSPTDAFVDGMRIPWRFVGQTAALTIAVRAAVVLIVGCVVFAKRELARVQV